MIKEELKKEAEEWIAKNSKEFITNPNYSPFDYAEAIYLAGAEPREKRIDCLTLACENYREEMEKNLADAVKLEKENAELKRVIDNDVDKKIYTQLAKKAQSVDLYKNNLTKAKELLKDAYKIAIHDWSDPKWHDQVLRKVAQFLKEVEK